jgi:sigma-B regulation protein RsbU (phosphoserine phosphatase)
MPSNDNIRQLQDENQRLKSAVRELAVINEISSVINSTMTVEEISRRIIKKIVTAVEADEAALHTFSDKEEDLAPHTFVRGKRDSSSMAKAKLDIRIAGWIAHHKRPLLINDVKSDERFRPAELVDSPITSLLAVPLIMKGKLIGTLTVFNSRKASGFDTDDVRLLGIIGVQSAQIIENARLYQEELRLRQLEGEIQAARKIQQGFLPQNIPRIRGLDLYAGTLAAKEVGGDYYDVILPNRDILYFTLGDVSGKGVPAALLMSTIQGQARLLIHRNAEMTPAEILTELNRITCQLSGSGQFATMVVGRFESQSGELVLANGGHNFPIIVKRDGTIDELSESSLLIGAFEEAVFFNTTRRLCDGELLVIASDGIDEAFNETAHAFSLDRLKLILIDNRGNSAEEIYRLVIDSVIAFRGAAEQSDDMTLLIMKKLA